MVLVLEDDFEFILATFIDDNRQPLRQRLHRVQLLYLGFIISTLGIALANIPRDVLVLMSTLEIVLANNHRDVLVLMSTLKIVLANIHRDVLVLLDVADVSINATKWTFLIFCLCVPCL